MVSNKDILEYIEFPDYDILYTDPPWGNSMVKHFETVRRRDTGIDSRHNIVELITKLAELANKNKPLFIEYSTSEYQQVIEIMVDKAHRLNNVTPMIQTNHNPYMLLSFNTDIKIEPYLVGKKGILDVLKKTNPKIVFDPFAGIGFTAKVVLKYGATYIGSEFNYARYIKLSSI